jgi:hypothetical protein
MEEGKWNGIMEMRARKRAGEKGNHRWSKTK